MLKLHFPSQQRGMFFLHKISYFWQMVFLPVTSLIGPAIRSQDFAKRETLANFPMWINDTSKRS